MKSLICKSAVLYLVGSALLGSFLIENLPALALPAQQTQKQAQQGGGPSKERIGLVIEKLLRVPVFMIMNAEGKPLADTVRNNNQDIVVTPVYMSGQEAQAFITKLRNLNGNDPKLSQIVTVAQTLEVKPLPLASIYQEILDNTNDPNRLGFIFDPVDQDYQAAMQLRSQSGQSTEDFTGVPLFLVSPGPDKPYLRIQIGEGDNSEEIIPVHLGKKEAESLLNQVKTQFPEASIQVVEIDEVIRAMLGAEDPWVNKVRFIPTGESVEFFNSLSPSTR
ncbi:MAG: Tic22 family protein [Coleofasciculaceae cyanobacterium]